GLLARIDDPVTRHLVMVIDPLFLDEVVALVGGEDLTDPVGARPDRDASRSLRDAFPAPADHIGPQGVHGVEVDIDLDTKPPPTRPLAARPPIIRIDVRRQLALHGSMLAGRRPSLGDGAFDELVAPSLVCWDGEQVIERGDKIELPR